MSSRIQQSYRTMAHTKAVQAAGSSPKISSTVVTLAGFSSMMVKARRDLIVKEATRKMTKENIRVNKDSEDCFVLHVSRSPDYFWTF